MPGLVGFVTKEADPGARERLAMMIAALRHEESYVSGQWIEESLGVYVGWVARRGSFGQSMPVWNERHDVTLVFSGEEFPAPETLWGLRKAGHPVDSDRPEYLVSLYEEDPRFPAGLNGRFQGLLVDHRQNTTVLFNDRYGIHRLYYHETPDTFYFAAEAKAILSVCPTLRQVEPKSLGELVAVGCTLENRSLFREISLLPGASAWTLRSGSITAKKRYFDWREWEEQPILDEERYYEELRTVFSSNLPRYFGGQHKIGISLTGGVDNRMIMAWQQAAPGTLPCYTFSGMIRDSQDAILARDIAKACGQQHTTIRVGSRFLSRFADYADRTVYMTDGCADVSYAAVLYANEQAARIAPVRMTGNYGGEILRGLRGLRWRRHPWSCFDPDLRVHLDEAKATVDSLPLGRGPSFITGFQVPWHHFGLLALEETQISLRTPYLDNDLVRTVFQAPRVPAKRKDVSLRLVRDGNPDLMNIRTDRGHYSPRRRRLSRTIRRGMLQSSFKLEYVYNYGMPHWLARLDRVARPLHPENLFLGRHKYRHFRVWYRDALASYVRDTLLDARTLRRPYVCGAEIRRIVTGHLSGGRNYTTEIHTLLTLELIHRLLIDPR